MGSGRPASVRRLCFSWGRTQQTHVTFPSCQRNHINAFTRKPLGGSPKGSAQKRPSWEKRVGHTRARVTRPCQFVFSAATNSPSFSGMSECPVGLVCTLMIREGGSKFWQLLVAVWNSGCYQKKEHSLAPLQPRLPDTSVAPLSP